MKTLAISALILSSSIAFAKEDTVKQCSVTLPNISSPSQIVDMDLTIISNQNQLSAIIKQTINGESMTANEVVTYKEEKVRAGLTVDTNVDGLNMAESLVVHAMILSTDPVFTGTFSAGIDLSQVRSAKLYTVGASGDMGNTTIVEAYDQAGKVLGSFLGGFLVSPCK